jgi:high affinity Mn2+ porin
MGFELGDGFLNYSPENLTELYYSFQMSRNISLKGNYQHIINPGYNKDRRSMDVLSLHLHLEIKGKVGVWKFQQLGCCIRHLKSLFL